ncbi:MAG TPA: uracil-DNA glycosylase family protein, partial [Paracoccaceae bacterium]|nr:uracil-DNA glycosylase family protein [Paracoccaceae bacterium]
PQVRLTLLVGSYAQAWHLGRRAPLTEAVRGWRVHLPAMLSLPHPSWRNTAWLRRNPWFEEEVVPWLRAEVSRLLR